MEQLCPAVSPCTEESDVAPKTLIQALGVYSCPVMDPQLPVWEHWALKALLQSHANMQPYFHIHLEDEGY